MQNLFIPPDNRWILFGYEENRAKIIATIFLEERLLCRKIAIFDQCLALSPKRYKLDDSYLSTCHSACLKICNTNRSFFSQFFCHLLPCIFLSGSVLPSWYIDIKFAAWRPLTLPINFSTSITTIINPSIYVIYQINLSVGYG